MGRISAWFGGLRTSMKALVVVACLVAFAVLSPLLVPLASLFLLMSVLVVAFRILKRRPFQRPGIFLLSSLAVLLLASGVSSALYGTSTEQARSPSNSQTKPKQEKARQEPAQNGAEGATPETTVEPAKAPPEKTAEQAAAKPKPKHEPKPEPKPQSEPKPEPKPAPPPAGNKNRSLYDATVTVSRVVDGDTVEVSPAIKGVEDVRLIGVDTPETVDPSEDVEPYGPEASAFTTTELTGKTVNIEFDVERTDQYDRLLAYVYTNDSMFNTDLVEKGYAQAYPYPPNTKYEARFAAAQAQAKKRTSGFGD